MERYVVGITGGSASGKTEFIKKLLGAFSPSEICLLSQDHYYHPIEKQPIDDNGVENFDTPQSIDHDAFLQDILALKSGTEIRKKEYTFNNPLDSAKLLTFSPAPIIICEGLFSFYDERLRDIFNLKIFVEANEPTKLTRRIKRDKIERGYDLDDVLYRYENHVYPTYRRYIEPFKHDSDLIIPNHDTFEKGLEVVVSHLKSKL